MVIEMQMYVPIPSRNKAAITNSDLRKRSRGPFIIFSCCGHNLFTPVMNVIEVNRNRQNCPINKTEGFFVTYVAISSKYPSKLLYAQCVLKMHVESLRFDIIVK